MITFKQICSRCKKNYVIATHRDRYPVCFECQKNELSGEISDPEMKKFFDLPEKYYKENSFLRSIKINYLRYGKLTEPQVEAYKKTVAKLREANDKK
jgi:ribosomal protein S27AE